MKELTLQEVRSICDEILGRYQVSYSDYQEERKDGEVKFVHLTLKFKLSNKGGDETRRSDKLAAKPG